MSRAVHSRMSAKARPVPTEAGAGRQTRDSTRAGLLSPAIATLLNAPGAPLPAGERSLMETRFGHDFGGVRIHADSKAGSTAAALGAKAYTLGDHIVLGPGGAATDQATRHRLLAHELAHVVQQSGHSASGPVSVSNARQEREAQHAATEVLTGRPAPPLMRESRRSLAPFSDDNHHVIDEAALGGSAFDASQIKTIERGNKRRDYSQTPAALNAVLLGSPHGFGGYQPAEHFDNFIYDPQTQRWRTRNANLGEDAIMKSLHNQGQKQSKFLHLDPAAPDYSPLDYVRDQLLTLARERSDPNSLEHLGNAFHTVEDFFAHSNFMELTRGDTSFGTDLLTGSFETDPANTRVSLAHTLGAVSTPEMKQQYYDKVAEAQTARTEPMSHSRLSKDTAQSPGFAAARRLAALVIQDLTADVMAAMHKTDPEERIHAMQATVLAKIQRYLRPPDPKDPWWEGLVERGGGAMDARLAEAEKRTPVTVNQMPLSPLRNLEASRDSTMAMPVGVATQLGKSSWLQFGAGVTRQPSALDSRLPDVDARDKDARSRPFFGAQITGRF